MIKTGTTEGRFRMAMPDILAEMKDICPDEKVLASMTDAVTLRDQVGAGKLDFVFSGLTENSPDSIEYSLLYVEHLYFVISDNMMGRYLKDSSLADGGEIDVSSLSGIPVSRSLPGLHCMEILDELLNEEGQTLNCVHVSPQFDLHQELAVRDLAACFCLDMYLPNVQKLNAGSKNKLHVFRIKNLRGTNPVYILRRKDHEVSQSEYQMEKLVRDWFGKLDELKVALGLGSLSENE